MMHTADSGTQRTFDFESADDESVDKRWSAALNVFTRKQLVPAAYYRATTISSTVNNNRGRVPAATFPRSLSQTVILIRRIYANEIR